MPLTVTIVRAHAIKSFNVSRRVLMQRANSGQGNVRASTQAATLPFLATDTRQIHYQRRRVGTQVEFRFHTGSLVLRYWHDIYYANTLSSCAHDIWKQHELEHVRDNRQLMARMDGEIRRDPTLRSIFIARPWRAVIHLPRTNRDIDDAVNAIFVRLTETAVNARDTRRVYRRIDRKILNSCPGPFYHTVERNETLSSLALYYFGRTRLWPAIHNRNRGTIGSDPDLIAPGQRLLIPKNPRVR